MIDCVDYGNVKRSFRFNRMIGSKSSKTYHIVVASNHQYDEEEIFHPNLYSACKIHKVGRLEAISKEKTIKAANQEIPF